MSERESAALVFLGLGNLTQNGCFRFHAVACKFHDVNLFYSQMIFHCANATHFHYPCAIWRLSGLFPFPSCCEQSSNERGEQEISLVGSKVLWVVIGSGATGSHGRAISSCWGTSKTEPHTSGCPSVHSHHQQLSVALPRIRRGPYVTLWKP